MSTYSYKADQRGKLVNVVKGDSSKIYSAPAQSALTAEFVEGPQTLGTATGKVYTDGALIWIEVLRVNGTSLFGIPDVTVIYCDDRTVTLATNPNYDPAKDTSAPNADGSVKGEQTTDTSDVSQTNGPGRVAVTGSDGKVVYVLVPKPTDTTSVIGGLTTTTSDTTKKWLTYGLYGVLGLAVITIMTILVISLSKKKKP